MGREALLFVIASLAAYRIQRIVTADAWPPTKWFREKLEAKYGDESSIYTLFTCPWCFGFWVTVAVFVILHFWTNQWVMLVAHIMAASTIVGVIGKVDD